MEWNGFIYIGIGLVVRAFSMLIVIRPVRQYCGVPLLSAVSFGLMLGAFQYIPADVVQVVSQLHSSAKFIPFVVLQSMIGCLLGIPFALLCEAAAMSGRLIDVSRGAHFAEQVVFGSSDKVSILERAAQFCFVCGALAAGGYQFFYIVFVKSIETFRYDLLNTTGLLGAVKMFCWELVNLSGMAIECAVVLSGLAMLLCFLVDVCVAMAGKSAGRVQVQFEFFGFKLLAGLGALWIVLVFDLFNPIIGLAGATFELSSAFFV